MILIMVTTQKSIALSIVKQERIMVTVIEKQQRNNNKKNKSNNLPNIVCLPSNQGVGARVIKN